MPSSNSLTTIRHHILDRHPELGFYFLADSVAAGSVTSAAQFGHSRDGGDTWADLTLYRYEETDSDRIKVATTVTTAGVLSHGSTTAYGTTGAVTSLNFDMLGPLGPDEFNGCIQRSLRHIRFFQHLALGVFDDSDMETSGVTNWSANNATRLKTTTAGAIFSGTQALEVTLTSANGYVRSPSIAVQQYTTLYTAVNARVNPTPGTGTFGLDLYDVTNNATFGTTRTYVGFDYGHIWRYDTIPGNCKQIQVQLSGTTSGMVFDADCVVGPYKEGVQRIALPSWMDEQYKIHALRPTRYRQFANSALSGVDQADTRFFEGDWEAPVDFSIENEYRATTQNHLLLHRLLRASTDYWLLLERPFYDVETLATETSTTLAPLEAVIDFSCVEVFKILKDRFRDEPRWQELWSYYTQMASRHVLARPSPPKVPAYYNLNVRA